VHTAKRLAPDEPLKCFDAKRELAERE